ncbi:MAG: serine/threonine protein kinase, partial [Myxococcota bacterium]|nr:serine/threonine protein kinase [Myxococcota bacterium]
MGDLSGQVIDRRYQIIERIADGAMGIVYRAIRLNLDRPVAVKVMHASLRDEMKGKERFEREAKMMAKLEHPHCVSIIDFGLHGNKPFVVMELVRGRSLYEVLVEQGRFEVTRALDIMGQVLSGLAHAHEQGIIHRDIKPANIMVTPKA